ncbi:MAG TPA: hypothetical protein VFQ25_17725 [Ktedonobacterales bacterium]|nr:hypothetical protein [Ktedonobacterales bacterium]
MDQRRFGGATYSAPDDALVTEAQAPTRCSICQRRLGRSIHFLDETGDVPEPRMSWALCDTCNTAVREQMRQSPLQGPLRLRVAVALVSTERTPAARRAHIGQMSDQHWETLLFWAFLLFMLGHLVLIVIVASIAK